MRRFSLLSSSLFFAGARNMVTGLHQDLYEAVNAFCKKDLDDSLAHYENAKKYFEKNEIEQAMREIDDALYYAEKLYGPITPLIVGYKIKLSGFQKKISNAASSDNENTLK